MSESNNALNETDKIWVNLFESLKTFISAATSLTENLRIAVTASKANSVCGTQSQNSTIQSQPSNVSKAGDSGHEADVDCNQFENDCICPPSEAPKTKNFTKSKAKELKKQKEAALQKVKSEKLNKLKDNLATAQQNLGDIQEELRQLERLYTDFDNFNTCEGQVNPAALYKEIMKPQVIPRYCGNK